MSETLTGLLIYLGLCLGCLAVIALAIRRVSLTDESETMEISDEQLKTLYEIRLRAVSRREQLEALQASVDRVYCAARQDSARACEVLGIDPDRDTEMRCHCDDLAYNGVHVVPMLARVAKAKDQE